MCWQLLCQHQNQIVWREWWLGWQPAQTGMIAALVSDEWDWG